MDSSFTVTPVDENLRVEWIIPDAFQRLGYSKVHESPTFQMAGSDWVLTFQFIKLTHSDSGFGRQVRLVKKTQAEATHGIVYLLMIDGANSGSLMKPKKMFWDHRHNDALVSANAGKDTRIICGIELIPISPSEGGTSSTQQQTIATRTASSQTSLFISETNPQPSLEVLSENFERLYHGKSDWDCVLKAENPRFAAHRTVLSARSNVFKAMFHNDTPESRSGEVDVTDVPATILNDVLRYIYSGKIRGLNSASAAPMFAAADKYALFELREACLDYIIDNLTFENICEAAVIAYVHAEDALKRKVLRFVSERFVDVMESDAWERFNSERPKLAHIVLAGATYMRNAI